jgi:hypothetical protein
MTTHNRLTGVATAALLAALAAGPAMAQLVEDDAVIVEPEVVDPGSELLDPEPDVEIVQPEVEVVDPELVDPEPDLDDIDVVDPGSELLDPEPDVEVVETVPGMLEGLISASQIQGGQVYALGDAYDEAYWETEEVYGYDEGYQAIGEIADVVLDRSGSMVGILANVGVYLGAGDFHVLMPVEEVRLMEPELGFDAEAGLADDTQYSYVTRLTAEALEAIGPYEGYYE